MTHPKNVWHLNDDRVWIKMTMEAVDANHAVDVDPDRWSFEKPADPAPEQIEIKEPGAEA